MRLRRAVLRLNAIAVFPKAPPQTLPGLVAETGQLRLPPPQNSVELLRFRALGQPPVREAGVPSAAVSRTRQMASVGVKRLPAPAFRMAFRCLFIPHPMDP